MNSKPNYLCLTMILWMMAAWSGRLQGAIIWNGPTIEFSQPAGVGTRVQDQLTPGVALTRGTTQGLINGVTETTYTHNFSPQDTEWAYGLLADYASLSYTDWEEWNGVNPPSMVGQPAVVHLIAENIYLSLTFTSWGESGLGGFSYVRSRPGVPPPTLSITLSGTNAILTWPATANGYNLQSTSNLVSPVVWSNVSGQYAVTNSITGSQMFYRLSK
jgi:hypothetical protein